MRTKAGLLLGCSVLFCGIASGAQAGAFLIRDQSAAGFGMAIAGVAAGDVLSYSFWNPAVLSSVSGVQFEAVLTGILPSVEITPSALTNYYTSTAPGAVEIGRDALVPAGFASYQINDALTVGVAVTSPFGLATRSPDNWAGQVYSRESEIRSINVNPMLSWRVNDMLSIGAGVQVEYLSAKLSQAVAVTPGAPSATFDADNIGLGFNLGVQLTPWKGTTIGVGYRSSISHDMQGSLEQPGLTLSGGTTLDTPDVLSIGIRQEITEDFRLLGTVEWDNWSRLGALPVKAAGGIEAATLYLNYRDGWFYSIGAEYDATDKLTVRAGIGYEVAPLTTANRDTRFPETDQLVLSAGLSYKYNDNVSFDLAYLYSKGLGDGDIDINDGDGNFVGLPFQATSDLAISIISVGLRVKFDTVRTAAR